MSAQQSYQGIGQAMREKDPKDNTIDTQKPLSMFRFLLLGGLSWFILIHTKWKPTETTIDYCGLFLESS